MEAGGRNSAFHSKSPKSAGLEGPGLQFRLTTTPVDLSATSPAVTTTHNGGRHTAPNSPLVTHSSLSLTPSSATSSNQAFTHFPVPPPLIPVPQGSGSAAVAVAMAAMTNAFNASKAKAAQAAGSSGFPTPPTDVSPYAWTHSPMLAASSPFSPLPLSPFPVTSLLSPTTSHPSSLSSSREDIQNTVEREIMKRRYLWRDLLVTYYIPYSLHHRPQTLFKNYVSRLNVII